MSTTTGFQAPVATRFSDGTVVHEYSNADGSRDLSAATPGRQKIRLHVEPYTDHSRSVSGRTAAAATLARMAPVRW